MKKCTCFAPDKDKECECKTGSQENSAVERLVSCHDKAFKTMCMAYPHEMHAQWPSEFMEYAKVALPGISEEEIIRVLKKTEGS